MALYVNTNVSSLNAKRMLNNSTNSLDTTYKRLASGLRINSAKDDAAGLQISNRLTSQINGLEQGNRNAQDGISYAQTAEGAMDEMTTMFQRVRTLALQSANGTNSDKDRTALQEEVTSLCSEIDRIANDTTFAGKKLLVGTNSAKSDLSKGNATGETSTVNFQVGADANQTIGVEISQGADKYGFDMNGFTTALSKSLKITAADGSSAAIEADDILDNTKPQAERITGFVKNGNSIAFDISTSAGAQNVIANIDYFIQSVDSKRAELGAVQNRLESTIRNQSNVSENVSDARSRIRDTDFATETANMTQQSIIQQASQSILSQANQRTQLALSLLG